METVKKTTQAQIRATNKYNREKRKAVAIRLSLEKMAQFEKACAELGTNKNAVLISAVNEIIKQAGLTE